MEISNAELQARKVSNLNGHWVVPPDIDTTGFNFDWRPHPYDKLYIHQFGTQHAKTGGPKWVVPGATEIKYQDCQRVNTLPRRELFSVLVDTKKYRVEFDWSWHPDENEPPMRWIWGNQYLSAVDMPTVEWIDPRAQGMDPATLPVKWVSDSYAKLCSYSTNWRILHPITNSFDKTWVPHPYEPTFIWVWGNQYLSAEDMPTVEYHPPGSDENTPRKYMSDRHADITGDPNCWRIHDPHITPGQINMQWAPHPHEPPWIYTWGNKWVPGEVSATIEYIVPGATQRKYMGDDVQLESQPDRWVVLKSVDDSSFDWSWRPNPHEPPYIYVWGNQHYSATEMPTVEYHVPGATEYKYITDEANIVSPGTPKLTPSFDNWVFNDAIDTENFDLSWLPPPQDPPYIYVWGNKHVPGEVKPTVEYRVPGASEYKFMRQIVPLTRNDNWLDLIDIDETNWDWGWRPEPNDPPYIYVWGNQWWSAVDEPTLEYHVPGATDRKYMDWPKEQNPKVLPSNSNWHKLISVDDSSFDWSWRPNPNDPPYIYVWGNQWWSAVDEPTLEYRVPGATSRKYMEWSLETNPVTMPTNNWHKLISVDDSLFDWSWRPNPHDPPYIYVWGNQWWSAVDEPTVEYRVPGATERKYIDCELDRNPVVLPSAENWQIKIPVKQESFDWSWRPNPHDPPYIYVWGNQWCDAVDEPTVEYHVPGATERKYIECELDKNPRTLPSYEFWHKLIPVDDSSFDWSWRPNPHDPPYIYVWGNQWWSAVDEPTLEYRMPGATDKKYVDWSLDKNPRTPSSSTNWHKLIPVDDGSFDWSWHPNPNDPPYIYVWGNQWWSAVDEPTVEYRTPGATDRKYMDWSLDRNPKTSPSTEYWHKLISVDDSSFDWSWRPNPNDPPYIYVWGNQWWSAEIESTVEYRVPGATERKFMSERARVLPVNNNWSMSDQSRWKNWDTSWRPNPHSPPQIYQWADGGPTYTIPGATEVVFMEDTPQPHPVWVQRQQKIDDVNVKQNTEEMVYLSELLPRYTIKTTLEDLILEHPTEVFWALNPYLDYSNWDWSWRPNKENFRHINVFANDVTGDTGTYYVNGPLWTLGHRERNYVKWSAPLDTKLNIVWIDTGAPGGDDRWELVRRRYPHAKRTRWAGSWLSTVSRAVRGSTTPWVWILSGDCDYSATSFDYYPPPWSNSDIHVIGTQWNHWGNTYLVNVAAITQYAKDTGWQELWHLPKINHLRGRSAPLVSIGRPRLHIVFDENNTSITAFADDDLPTTDIILWRGSYLATLQAWIADGGPSKIRPAHDRMMWITSDIQDYSDWDWSWSPDPYARGGLHVFPSRYRDSTVDRLQRQGDTFLLDTEVLRTIVLQLDSLSRWTNGVVWVSSNQSIRKMPPVVSVSTDTLSDAVNNVSESWPYTVVELLDTAKSGTTTYSYNKLTPPTCWAEDTMTVTVQNSGATLTTVPRAVRKWVSNGDEIYRYPHIDVKNIRRDLQPPPLDIVFISNGEPIAEENWQHLQRVLSKTGAKNTVHRIDGVNGRIASQHAAAHTSHSAWYFLINGKLEVNDQFDWNWQPDRLQAAKHYIFSALNPVNGLRYGHQAIVANNRRLTLDTVVADGLDFTMARQHAVVDMDCGVARYNTDAWTAWRTAFRESIKLKCNTDEVSAQRLSIWCSEGTGQYADWSQRGALDGIEYWHSVDGKLESLMLSYDWDWIRQHYEGKYGK